MCSLKRICRKAEWKWKATQLAVHLHSIKIFMKQLNSEIKNAQINYFADIIEINQHNRGAL